MYCDIGNDNYWYERHGNIGPVIVLLHGFTGSSNTWQTLITERQDKFQFIAIDLPGHGKTKVNTVKTMKQCCEDIKTILDYLKLDEFHLLGYSMGGRTALSFAMYYPDGLKSLILESASPGLPTQLERKERIEKDEKLAEKLVMEGIEAFVDFWEGVPLFRSQYVLPRETQIAIRKERLAQSPQGLADSLRGMGTGKQPSWWGELNHINIPVLLLAGEWDKKFIQVNKNIEKRLPQSKLSIVNKAGHAIHVEQSEIFGRIVTEFILDMHDKE